MTEKQLKNYVLNIFKFKRISAKQFANVCNNLEQLKEREPVFYYFNMGKLYATFDSKDVAISYLKEAIKMNCNIPGVYYNLYKCYVKSGNIEDAEHALNSFLNTNKSNVNFCLMTQALYRLKLIDQSFSNYLTTSSEIVASTRLGFNDLRDDERLLNLYTGVIDAFNKKDYNLCLEKLYLMNLRIMDVNYPMEVDSLISLVSMLKEKEIIEYTRILNDDSLDLSKDEYCEVQLKLLSLGKYSPEAFLRIIEENIVSDNLWIGTNFLNSISSMPKFKKYQDMIEYLQGCIREKEAYLLQLNPDEQEEFETIRRSAKSFYRRKANDEALVEYNKAKEMSGLVVCDYYIGKIFFRQGKFNQAREMFLNYLQQGGFKTEKALMFLGQIERIQKNNTLSKKYLKRMQKIHTVFEREYFYDFYRFKKKKKKCIEDSDEHDFLKTKRSKTVRMDPSDFISEPQVPLEEFYDVDVDGKLSIIRGLLKTGNDSVANKLIEEVRRESDSSDKAKVMQFVRNKKIYKNQNRTS